MHNPENVSGGAGSTPSEPELASSVRVQAALESDPGNWKGFEEMELVNRNPSYAVFQHDFGEPIDKVQFEMYGIFTDFALADITGVGAVGQGPTGTDGEDGATGAAGAVGATGVGLTGPAGATGAVSSAWFEFSPINALAGQNVGFVHNLGTENIIVSVYDSNNEELIPATVDVVNDNQITLVFSADTNGARVVITGEVV
jgi:hypothetical protein